MKVLCLGSSIYNVTSYVKEYPKENGNYSLMENIFSGAGSAYNISCLLSLWGIETYIASMIGSDDLGNKIKKELEQNGVKLDYLETTFDKPTLNSFTLVNTKGGIDTTFNIVDDLPHLKKEDWKIEPDLIVGDGAEYYATLTAMNKFQNINSVILATKNTTEVIELCKYSKYIICSKTFAEELANYTIDFNNANTLVVLYNKILEKFPKSIIIIALDESGVLYSVNGNIKIMQGIKVIPKDLSKANDIFCGSFIYGLLTGYDLEKCLQIANIAMGLKIQNDTYKKAIPTLNEVLEYYSQKFSGPSINTESGMSTNNNGNNN